MVLFICVLFVLSLYFVFMIYYYLYSNGSKIYFRCDQVLIVLAKNLTTTEHVKTEANVSENVRPGTIVTFIGVSM